MSGFLYFLLPLLFALACLKESDGIKTLEISDFPNNSPFYLSAVSSEVEYVPLDTSLNIYLDKSHKFQVADEFLFILEYRDVKRFTAYNIYTGKRLFEIVNMGSGPEGMANPTAFFVDIDNNRIEIYDSMKRKLFFYDLGGAFLKAVDLGLFISDFTKSKANDYFFYTGRAINSTRGGKISEALIITDSTFKIKNAFFESNPFSAKLFIRSSRNFSWHNDSLYFIQSPDNHLYRIEGDSVAPVLKLDFKEKTIPNDLLENSAGVRLSEWLNIVRKKGYCMGIAGYFTNDSFELIKFTSIKDREHYYVKSDKGTSTYNYYSQSNFINDVDNGLFGEIIHLDNKQLITVVEGYQLAEALNEKPDFENPGLFRLLSRKSKFDNPILVFYKLK